MAFEHFVSLIIKTAIPLSKVEVEALFAAFDPYGEGSVPHAEFLGGVIGTMNEQRKMLVDMLFELLDTEKEGTITIEALKKMITPAKDPCVIRKKKKVEDSKKEFEESFELFYNELVQLSIS